MTHCHNFNGSIFKLGLYNTASENNVGRNFVILIFFHYFGFFQKIKKTSLSRIASTYDTAPLNSIHITGKKVI
jgi:hypothetical protein